MEKYERERGEGGRERGREIDYGLYSELL